MLADRLSKAWVARRGSTAIDPIMRFSDEGLVLGAGTVLAFSGRTGRDIAIDPLEPRLHALLSAAHLRRPTASALAHLRKAAERWSDGQDEFAAMHLALSQVERLTQPEADAHRLFLADGLLTSGVGATAVMNAVKSGDTAFEQLRKFNPDQPRVPAGSGATSGEWTSGDNTSVSPPTEVSPITVTPPAAPFYGPQACKVARISCVNNTLTDAMPPHAANDNGLEDQAFEKCKQEEYKQCYKAFDVCEVLSFIVNYTPFIQRSAVIFPDRGIVLSDKGDGDSYFSRETRGYMRVPPMKSR